MDIYAERNLRGCLVSYSQWVAKAGVNWESTNVHIYRAIKSIYHGVIKLMNNAMLLLLTYYNEHII